MRENFGQVGESLANVGIRIQGDIIIYMQIRSEFGKLGYERRNSDTAQSIQRISLFIKNILTV